MNYHEAETPAPSSILLQGTLTYCATDGVCRHLIRGKWNDTAANPDPNLGQTAFELVRDLAPEEDLKELPQDGEFHGFFDFNHRRVPENEVKIMFVKLEGTPWRYSVSGRGNSEFGEFELNGTANTTIPVKADSTYTVSLQKKYIRTGPSLPTHQPQPGGFTQQREAMSTKPDYESDDDGVDITTPNQRDLVVSLKHDTYRNIVENATKKMKQENESQARENAHEVLSSKYHAGGRMLKLQRTGGGDFYEIKGRTWAHESETKHAVTISNSIFCDRLAITCSIFCVPSIL